MGDEGVFSITVDMGIALSRLVRDRRYRQPRITLRLERRLTLGQLIQWLGIPSDHISFVSVNGYRSDWDTVLGADDKVMLFPYVAGG